MFEFLTDPTSPFFWVFIALIILVPLLLISRPFLAYIRFIYPNAKYEAIGNPFITPKELNNLIESKSLNGFIETLNTHKDYQIQGTTISEIQQSLDHHLLETIAMLQKDNTEKIQDYFRLFIEKHDYALMRHQIKATIFPYLHALESQRPYQPHIQKFIEQLKVGSKETLPELLHTLGIPRSLIDQLTVDTPDPLRIDSAFDTFLINRFLTIPLPYRCDPARTYFVKTWVDMLNITNVLRAKHLQYSPEQIQTLFVGDGQEISAWKYKELAETDQIPQIIQSLEGTSYFPKLKDAIEQYHQQKSIQPLEHAIKQQYLDHLRTISLKYYQGLGPQLRFIVSKEYEMNNLKIIAKGVADQVPTDMIKPLLLTSEVNT